MSERLTMEHRRLIIDSHSHIGVGFNNRIATIEEYQIIKDKLNITISLLMPQPILNNLPRNQSTIDNLNAEVYKNISSTTNNLFIPMISPIYTSSYDLERYIEIYQPVALKIHLKNDSSYPEIIPIKLTETIKKHNIPLIVHTDYSKTSLNEKETLKNLNSALKWLNYFKKNSIKGYLTHGARLSPEVLESINFEEEIVIGIGPDILLGLYQESLEQKGDFLKILYNYVNPKRLLFDLDYNWNLDSNNNLELGSIKRIETLWNQEEQELILGKNSSEFFDIPKRLQKK